MSRRIREQELEAGSDSFLDIIANIVGILIILIVIAGVKVARQPLTVPAPEVVTDAEIPGEEIVTADSDAIPPEDAEPAPPPLPDVPPPIAPAAPDVAAESAPTIATEDFDDLERRIAELARGNSGLQDQVDRQTTEGASRSESIDDAIKGVTAAQTSLATLRRTIDEKRKQAEQLRASLASAEQTRVDVEQIEHKVTPVGVDVSGQEVHFRLLEGKLAFLPVDELIEELKTDAAKHQRWLLRNPRYQGAVGPIRGFRMKYELVRRSQSLAEELRNGVGMFRISVSEWELEPMRDIEQETLEQAARPGSRFSRKLRSLDHDTNVTFWVYPDSFDEFRALQKLVHAHGLTVAGRPLPFGVAIAGSPNGTRSSGQ